MKFYQRQSGYANEIERVLKELRLTVSLIKECHTRDLIAGVSRRELLAFYQGVYFTLVHQLKDKLLQLVHLMTEDVVPKNPTIENNIKLSNLLQKKATILREIGIEEELVKWEQDNANSKIAVVLRKRTHHHHHISGLIYDIDYLRLGLSD